MTFSSQVLAVDPIAVCARIEAAIREQVLGTLRRRGAVVGLSGGVDSSLVAALCARSLGPERVLALFMPERDSSPDSLRLGRLVADALAIPSLVEDVGAALAGAGCYARQDEAIPQVFPEWEPGWKCKLTLPSILDGDRVNVSYLTVAGPDGAERRARLPAGAYLQLVAATNMKQRTRKAMEYYHADRLVFAVAGTPNRRDFFSADLRDVGRLFDLLVPHLYRRGATALSLSFLGSPRVEAMLRAHHFIAWKATRRVVIDTTPGAAVPSLETWYLTDADEDW